MTPVRGIFNQVAYKLISEERFEEAEKVLDRCYEVTPVKNIPLDLALIRGSNEYEVLTSIDNYLSIDRFEKAQKLGRAYIEEAAASMLYSSQEFGSGVLDEDTLDREMQYASYMAKLFASHGHQDEADWINNRIKSLAELE